MSPPNLAPAEPVRLFFFFQAEDCIRDKLVTGVQTCALPLLPRPRFGWWAAAAHSTRVENPERKDAIAFESSRPGQVRELPHPCAPYHAGRRAPESGGAARQQFHPGLWACLFESASRGNPCRRTRW